VGGEVVLVERFRRRSVRGVVGRVPVDVEAVAVEVVEVDLDGDVGACSPGLSATVTPVPRKLILWCWGMNAPSQRTRLIPVKRSSIQVMRGALLTAPGAR
jgi:hypothetical protein